MSWSILLLVEILFVADNYIPAKIDSDMIATRGNKITRERLNLRSSIALGAVAASEWLLLGV